MVNEVTYLRSSRRETNSRRDKTNRDLKISRNGGLDKTNQEFKGTRNIPEKSTTRNGGTKTPILRQSA